MAAHADGAALIRRIARALILPLAVLCVLCVAYATPPRAAVVHMPVALDATGDVRRVGGVPRIDINRADAAMLASIPGIGAGLAERIVADRAEKGDFESVEALLRVRGIGEAKLKQIAAFAVCG